jgi:tRNA (mo5U34)-methyltransferase
MSEESMATGYVRWRGFNAEVSVPDRLAHPGRRAEFGALRVKRSLPRLRLQHRDPHAALAFLGMSGTPGPDATALSSPSGSLEERIAALPWYHTVELPGGVVTPGRFDHRTLLPHYGLPADLSGKTALDVATFDGFWAFEMERRGAQVTAIDLATTRNLDFPTRVAASFGDRNDFPVLGEGFAIAKEARGSSVDRQVSSVYELDPDVHGMFDLVHCGDLLLHLRHPLRAIESMRKVCRGQFLLSDCISLTDCSDPQGATMIYRGGWHDVTWWLPSLNALAQMVIDAGFKDVAVNSVYNLAATNETEGHWRASLTATV